MKILVTCDKKPAEGFGLEKCLDNYDVAYAANVTDFKRELPGSEVILGWNYRGNQLKEFWHLADALKWIHLCWAGVDGALFPELTASDVALTNARGIYDRSMAEYVLGLILIQAKDMQHTLNMQTKHVWDARVTEKIADRHVVIFGVGSIARELARMLKAVGMHVNGVGRRPREGDPDFGQIYSKAEGLKIIGQADWVIGILPATESTISYFESEFFEAMNTSARFINMGRGVSVDEVALLNALNNGDIAGAALDVFSTEPLPPEHPIWETKNILVSPHMSGDYFGYEGDLVKLFAKNLERYTMGQSLSNLVDKNLGYAAR